MTVTPSANGARFRLALWKGRSSGWQFGDLRREDFDQDEGQAMPFMLRIDNASPGTVYNVVIRYNCRIGASAAFEFLTGYERDVGTDPALAQQGPGRSRPDASIPIPDDPSIALDDEAFEGERLFQLWGATFDAEPAGPVPDTPCDKRKLISLSIRAKAEEAFLMWGGHLASSKD